MSSTYKEQCLKAKTAWCDPSSVPDRSILGPRLTLRYRGIEKRPWLLVHFSSSGIPRVWGNYAKEEDAIRIQTKVHYFPLYLVELEVYERHYRRPGSRQKFSAVTL